MPGLRFGAETEYPDGGEKGEEKKILERIAGLWYSPDAGSREQYDGSGGVIRRE